MIFETHAHYDDSRFDEDRDSLLSSMPSHGIGTIVNITADYKSLKASFDIAHQYDFVYTTVGLHPTELDGLPENVISEMETLAADEKCVAVGEIGLDYHYEKDEAVKEKQKHWFISQLDLAKKTKLPVVIHSRDAAEDTMAILKDYAGDVVCDVHCFSYSPEIAEEYIKMGFFIGIGGVLTFSNAKKLVETVERIPLTSILLETDSPYLAPHPFRGERNDSTYLHYVVRKIAKIKGITEDEVIEVTEKNARRFYGL